MTRDYEEYLKDDNLHINWYPGHMKKTKEMVQNNLKLVDVVIELLDARIPLSSKNPEIDKLAQNKPRVVVLNKSDLSDKAKLNKWISYYQSKGIKAIPVDTLKGSGVNKIVEECEKVEQELLGDNPSLGRISSDDNRILALEKKIEELTKIISNGINRRNEETTTGDVGDGK